jgi:poly(A) polymerase/tRNA nucleotidyltransferase (CCA-adding enzyme)
MNRNPKDWDITTNATPEEIQPLFGKTIYENTFGTVGVCIPKVTHETKKEDVIRETPEYDIVEVTPYRIEAKYSDFRHPDQVVFSNNIEDDLKRRDFTINALAYNASKGHLIDLYNGQTDIKDKVIRSVGEASDRFTEDALRMLRAVRFSTQLDFAISYETMSAITENAVLLKNISMERIRDEFTKIIESSNPSQGVVLLQKLGLLKYIIPELEEGIGCEQGGAHIYDVFEHLLGALGHAADKGYSTEIHLAALFHDIGKPKSRRPGIKKAYTFYGHEVIGARMAKAIMERLKYPKKTTDLVVSLVRNHMFFSDTEQITLSAVRRIVQKVGKEHIWQLMEIRECDRVGMKKAEAPYRLRKYHAMIDEVLRDPLSVGALAINGEVLIKELNMKPSRRMGWILHALLEEVLEDPKKNAVEYLKSEALELEKLDDKKLQELGEKAKDLKEKLEEEEIERVHKKHGVRK